MTFFFISSISIICEKALLQWGQFQPTNTCLIYYCLRILGICSINIFCFYFYKPFSASANYNSHFSKCIQGSHCFIAKVMGFLNPVLLFIEGGSPRWVPVCALFTTDRAASRRREASCPPRAGFSLKVSGRKWSCCFLSLTLSIGSQLAHQRRRSFSAKLCLARLACGGVCVAFSSLLIDTGGLSQL